MPTPITYRIWLRDSEGQRRLTIVYAYTPGDARRVALRRYDDAEILTVTRQRP